MSVDKLDEEHIRWMIDRKEKYHIHYHYMKWALGSGAFLSLFGGPLYSFLYTVFTDTLFDFSEFSLLIKSIGWLWCGYLTLVYLWKTLSLKSGNTRYHETSTVSYMGTKGSQIIWISFGSLFILMFIGDILVNNSYMALISLPVIALMWWSYFVTSKMSKKSDSSLNTISVESNWKTSILSAILYIILGVIPLSCLIQIAVFENNISLPLDTVSLMIILFSLGLYLFHNYCIMDDNHRSIENEIKNLENQWNDIINKKE